MMTLRNSMPPTLDEEQRQWRQGAVVVMIPAKPRRCNLYSDCDAASRKAIAKGLTPEPCCTRECDPDCDGWDCL